ncbi:MAG: hypothetical protein L0Y54_09730, partial [Sporichthyaceae bacterium]|nr:hypothetical protein [Sporichthyaceae bacterium]
MTLICVGSATGAPGVTTTALALAAVWPRPVLLAETDPAGSALLYRLGLDPRSGLVSLATATASPRPGDLAEHTQHIPGGLPVLAGVHDAGQGRAFGPLWDRLGQALAGLDAADTIADCGRLNPTGDSLRLLSHAALILLLVHSEIAAAAHLRNLAAALAGSWPPGDAPRLAVAIQTPVGQRDETIGQASTLLAKSRVPVALVTTIAADPAGAAELGVGRRRRVGESPLLRSARRLAKEL